MPYDFDPNLHTEQQMKERIAALEAEIAQLRKDAERLDWLIWQTDPDEVGCPFAPWRNDDDFKREWIKAIDAAMQRSEK